MPLILYSTVSRLLIFSSIFFQFHVVWSLFFVFVNKTLFLISVSQTPEFCVLITSTILQSRLARNGRSWSPFEILTKQDEKNRLRNLELAEEELCNEQLLSQTTSNSTVSRKRRHWSIHKYPPGGRKLPRGSPTSVRPGCLSPVPLFVPPPAPNSDPVLDLRPGYTP